MDILQEMIKMAKDTKCEPSIMDCINAMINQVGSVGYKPLVITIQIRFKVNEVKMLNKLRLKKQLIKIHALYEKKYCSKIKVLQIIIGYDGADFENGQTTMSCTIAMSKTK